MKNKVIIMHLTFLLAIASMNKILEEQVKNYEQHTITIVEYPTPEPKPEPDPIVVEVEEEVEEIIEAVYLEPEPEPDKEWLAFVSATWRLETGNGTSYLWEYNNNPGGIKCGTDYCTFSSKDEGMQIFEDLLQDYVDTYGYDFRAIRDRYCQCGPEDYDKFMEIYYEEYSKY